MKPGSFFMTARSPFTFHETSLSSRSLAASGALAVLVVSAMSLLRGRTAPVGSVGFLVLR